MTKAATADASPEAGIASMIGPMQEGFDRLRHASEKLHSTYSDIFTTQVNLMQENVLLAVSELQGLALVRSPVEFVELGSEFAWEQTQRSLKALSELSTEVCDCWFEALKSAPGLAKAPKGRAAH